MDNKVESYTEAENYIYESYVKTEQYLNYTVKDSVKRHPEFSHEIIRQLQSQGTAETVCITGSKGKGSTACMIARILQTQCKVGLMTSPHIDKFRERFQVNGEMISEENFIHHVSAIKPACDRITEGLKPGEYLSPMGIQTALALSFFNENNTDVHVFECGKGVRFDDVNHVKHGYAVINTIFLEHTRELGSTLREIAEDKSAIITEDVKFVYSAPQSQEVLEVIKNRAAETGGILKVYGRDFTAENIRFGNAGMKFDVKVGETVYREIELPLMGEHQARNCALALAVCEDVFANVKEDNKATEAAAEVDYIGKFIHEQTLRESLRTLVWPGRMEIISKEPLTILDACINAASCENVLHILENMNIEKPAVIIGIPEDKDYSGVARAMYETADKLILTCSSNPHYRFSKRQQEELKQAGMEAVWTDSFEEARELAEAGGRPVVILGTTSLIADVKRIYGEE